MVKILIIKSKILHMKWCTHDVFSIILLYNLYIFTTAQSKAQTDYFVKSNTKQYSQQRAYFNNYKAIHTAKIALI